MTLNEIYREYLHALQEIYSKAEAARITAMIFEHFTGFSSSDIIMHPAKEVGKETIHTLKLSLKDLLQNKPVQYVTGTAWFCDMKFNVDPSVLVPRPETEELVEAASVYIGKHVLKVLDIGTGSGCISIAIKKKNPDAIVTAVDISKDALEVARGNASSLGTVIELRETDFLDEKVWENLGQYDVMVSNPPYIPASEKQMLDKNVTEYEPGIALFVNDSDPFIFYRKIALFGKQHLKDGGKIFMESHEAFAADVVLLFQQQGYTAIIKKDIFEKDRMVIAQKDL